MVDFIEQSSQSWLGGLWSDSLDIFYVLWNFWWICKYSKFITQICIYTNTLRISSTWFLEGWHRRPGLSDLNPCNQKELSADLPDVSRFYNSTQRLKTWKSYKIVSNLEIFKPTIDFSHRSASPASHRAHFGVFDTPQGRAKANDSGGAVKRRRTTFLGQRNFEFSNELSPTTCCPFVWNFSQQYSKTSALSFQATLGQRWPKR